VDYPPFAFNSGMGWRPVTRAECERLGVTGPDGESIDAWQAENHPLLVDTQTGLPAPEISMRNADADVLAAFTDDKGCVVLDGIATPVSNKDALLAQLEARRIAREARVEQLSRDSILRRQEAYAAKP